MVMMILLAVQLLTGSPGVSAMSPLWPDLALARAAWADAVKRGLVNDSEPRAERAARCQGR